MGLGRFVSFLLITVVLGLLQLWILLLVLTTTGRDVSVPQLLGDGGLFFFATTLCASSSIALVDAHPLTIGDRDFNVTVLLCGLVVVVAVVVFSVVHGLSFGADPLPFASKTLAQIVCAGAAVSYWFYVGIRTGWFRPGA